MIILNNECNYNNKVEVGGVNFINMNVLPNFIPIALSVFNKFSAQWIQEVKQFIFLIKIKH